MTEQWKPPPKVIKELDFSHFHPLDHWPFARRCLRFPGGGWNHLKIAWQYHHRDRVLGPWYRHTRCRFGRHRQCFWTGPKSSWIGCLDCNWTRTPSEQELEANPRIVFDVQEWICIHGVERSLCDICEEDS